MKYSKRVRCGSTVTWDEGGDEGDSTRMQVVAPGKPPDALHSNCGCDNPQIARL